MITAEEARIKTNKKENIKRFLEIIQEQIECEIENGNYYCSIQNKEIIEFSSKIIEKLKELGYSAIYREDKNDRYVINDIYVSW